MAGFIDSVKVFTDGGSRGNPGPGAIGVLILDPQNNELDSLASYIGHATNNQAEYRALIAGLDRAAAHTRGTVDCYLDSELVVRQLQGRYRLKNPILRDLYHEVKNKERPFDRVTYTHVKRENPNVKKVDAMLNHKMDEHLNP